MKCLICGEKTDKSLLCKKHMGGVDACLPYLTANVCGSFRQKKEEPFGVCENYLLCAPIKKALRREILMNNLGHVVCPHTAENLGKIIYSKVSEDEIRGNYPECLE